MGNTLSNWTLKSFVTLGIALTLVGMVTAQVQPRQNRGRLRNQGGTPLQKVRPKGGDPLAAGQRDEGKAKKQAAAAAPGVGTFHYTMKLHSFDGTLLTSSYYPSKLGTAAPVLILVHEGGRSRKDFEEPVEELKGEGLAQYLQSEGFALFSMDLRGQGQNARRALTANDRFQIMTDLQAAYFFLLDRHNRGDLNLARLGILALGDSANLCASWANQPGAASAIEGRPSDLNALVLLSPSSSASGESLRTDVDQLVPRIPLALLTGARDKDSKDAVESVRQVVTRGRQNKIELFPSPLRSFRLMRLEPKVTSTILHFLEGTVKLRAVDWEPRYNLTPVTVSDIQTVQHPKAPTPKPDAKGAQGKEAEKERAKDADQAKPKEDAEGKIKAEAEEKPVPKK